MSDFAERLQFAIKQAGLTPSKVATEIDLSAQAPQKWKKGQVSLDTLIKIIELTGTDANWLLMGEQANQNQVNNQHGYIGGSVNQSVVHHNYPNCPIDEDWFEIANNDMFPTFAIGDRIRVDENKEPQAGNYVLVECDGLQVLRKYRPKGFDENGKPYTQLIADNEDYPVIDSRYQTFRVVGVAVEYKRKLV